MCSPGTIESQFRKYQLRYRNLLSGFILGAVSGEVLGYPFRGIPLNGQLQHGGQNIQIIDRVYMHDIGYQGRWLPEACRMFNSWQALIDLHNRDGSLRKNLRGEPLRLAFDQEYEKIQPVEPEPRVTPSLRRLTPYSLFIKLAPVAPFSACCDLGIHQTINFCFRIASLTHNDPVEIFPAVEFVLLLRSMFRREERIPDVLAQLVVHAAKREGRRRMLVAQYLSNRSRLVGHPETDLGIWAHVNASILGLTAGEPRSCLQGFENGLVRVVNTSAVRDLAGAVAGVRCSEPAGVKT
jgi:hypothetical protein